MICMGISESNAQFWQGLMYGIMQGAQQAAQQQQLRRQQAQSQQIQRRTNPIKETVKYEKDGFEWIRLRQWNDSKKDYVYGVKDENGKTIIPLSRGYTTIIYLTNEYGGGYFLTSIGDKEGACDKYGVIIFSPMANADYICSKEGKFEKKNSKGDWVATNAYLDSDGHVKRKSSGTSTWGGDWSTPYYGGTYYAPSTGGTTYNGNNSGNSTRDYKNDRKETLNRTVGEACLSCKGSGKCHACNGTKIASGFGLTHKCNLCNANGDCPTCGGTGKTSWNR